MEAFFFNPTNGRWTLATFGHSEPIRAVPLADIGDIVLRACAPHWLELSRSGSINGSWNRELVQRQQMSQRAIAIVEVLVVPKPVWLDHSSAI